MITTQQIKEFEKNGVLLLKDVVSSETVETILQEGLKIYPQHQAKRGQPKDFGSDKYWPIMDMYSLNNPTLYEAMTSDLMVEVTKTLLGDTVYLFNEQFVFKPAGDPYSVRWHTDNSCTPEPEAGLSGDFKAITCTWFLTSHDKESGGISYLPRRREAGILKEEVLDDLVDIIASPGDMAVWDGNIYHLSGGNKTARDRHLWLQVYSSRPIVSNRYKLPFILEGKKVL